jgi:hypothetical protein
MIDAMKQEPVAMRYDFDGYGYKYIDSGSGSNWQTRIEGAEPLYEAPPQQEKQEPVAWQGLTREETVSLARQHLGGMPIGREFVDAVEALLREKNTAPPQRQPLTDDELDDIWIHRQCIEAIQRGDILAQFRAAGRAVERKHGIGGEHD